MAKKPKNKTIIVRLTCDVCGREQVFQGRSFEDCEKSAKAYGWALAQTNKQIDSCFTCST